MSSTTTHRSAGAGGGVRDVLRVRVELWLAILFMALAFGAGMAVRVAGDSEQPAIAATSQNVGTSAGLVAPPLTDEQLEAGLPPGHPDLAPAQSDAPDKDGSKNGAKASGNDTKGSKQDAGNASEAVTP